METTTESRPQAQEFTYPFQLTELRYAYDGLEPHMDAETLEIHHGKHHRSYVTNLNAALKDHPDFHGMTIEELLRGSERLPEPLRKAVHTQGGGHENHQFFWSILRPGPATQPTPTVQKLIETNFGSFDAFKRAFNEAVLKAFGSGWVCLAVSDKNPGKLQIVTLHDHESVVPMNMAGLLICDVWEHAYYLKHQNRRADYLEAFWNLVDWDGVDRRLARGVSGDAKARN